MEEPKKLLSFKLQCFLSLIPLFGAIVVLFTGVFNIRKYKKTPLHTILYVLLMCAVIIIVLGVGTLAMYPVLLAVQDVVIKAIAATGAYVVFAMAAGLACVGVQKAMIKKLQEKERRELENKFI